MQPRVLYHTHVLPKLISKCLRLEQLFDIFSGVCQTGQMRGMTLKSLLPTIVIVKYASYKRDILMRVIMF